MGRLGRTAEVVLVRLHRLGSQELAFELYQAGNVPVIHCYWFLWPQQVHQTTDISYLPYSENMLAISFKPIPVTFPAMNRIVEIMEATE